jgi:beta-glucanase (GH16 family)
MKPETGILALEDRMMQKQATFLPVFWITAPLLLAALAGCSKPSAPGLPNSIGKPGWNLVFDDEFDGPTLNTSRWMTGFPWGRCSDIAFNTDGANLAFADGAVRLTARREPIKGFCFDWDETGAFTPFYKEFEYSTAMLYSAQAFKSGYYECRFQAPKGKGFNAAFWLYGEKAEEVDIFEIVAEDNGAAQMTLHWKDNDPLVNTSQWIKHILPSGPSFDAGFHTFAVEWTPEKVVWYLDNWEVPQTLFARFIHGRHIPDVEMNVILTLGVGGMGGDPDTTTLFPAGFLVDYVRVYQRAAA